GLMLPPPGTGIFGSFCTLAGSPGGVFAFSWSIFSAAHSCFIMPSVLPGALHQPRPVGSPPYFITLLFSSCSHSFMIWHSFRSMSATLTTVGMVPPMQNVFWWFIVNLWLNRQAFFPSIFPSIENWMNLASFLNVLDTTPPAVPGSSPLHIAYSQSLIAA